MNCLRYSVRLAYEVLDQTADLLLNIEAAHTSYQRVVSEELTLPPGVVAQSYTDPVLANRLLRLRVGTGPVVIGYQAEIEMEHRFDDPATLFEVPVAQLPFEVLPYLSPSRYCQSDRLLMFALREFGALQPGYYRIAGIADWVRRHVRFMSGASNETTSALDTIVQRIGVCRDFANLMIALCRALSVPARFSSSLDYGAAPELGPPDFHAFVEVYLSGRWYLFDPSGVSLPTGLLRIGTGHDASEIPFAAIFGNVRSQAPAVNFMAVVDLARGIDMPMATPMAICTW